MRIHFLVRIVLFILSVAAAVGLRGVYDSSFYFLYAGFLMLLFHAEWYEALGYTLAALWLLKWRPGFPPELLVAALMALGAYSIKFFRVRWSEHRAVLSIALASAALYVSIAGSASFTFMSIALRDVVVATLWGWGIARIIFFNDKRSMLRA